MPPLPPTLFLRRLRGGLADKFHTVLACAAGRLLGLSARCVTLGGRRRTDPNAESFPAQHRQNWCLRTRVCNNCEERQKCRGECSDYLAKTDFNTHEWESAGRPNSARGKCKKCILWGQEMKKCSGPCQESKADNFFSKRQCREDVHTRKCSACTML